MFCILGTITLHLKGPCLHFCPSVSPLWNDHLKSESSILPQRQFCTFNVVYPADTFPALQGHHIHIHVTICKKFYLCKTHVYSDPRSKLQKGGNVSYCLCSPGASSISLACSRHSTSGDFFELKSTQVPYKL